jgi:hypothetical protein
MIPVGYGGADGTRTRQPQENSVAVPRSYDSYQGLSRQPSGHPGGNVMSEVGSVALECEHDLAERETMCADGFCPTCSARAAVRAERERCAGIAENAGCLTYTRKHDIAAAIRAKPKEPTDGN